VRETGFAQLALLDFSVGNGSNNRYTSRLPLLSFLRSSLLPFVFSGQTSPQIRIRNQTFPAPVVGAPLSPLKLARAFSPADYLA